MEPNVTITPEQVDAIFAAAETQSDYVFNLYKLVIPKWDDVAQVDGYPRVNKATQSTFWRRRWHGTRLTSPLR